jgi:hypothetical protein
MQVPSARRLNSTAAQQRRGGFGGLAQDDNLVYFSQFCRFLCRTASYSFLPALSFLNELGGRQEGDLI